MSTTTQRSPQSHAAAAAAGSGGVGGAAAATCAADVGVGVEAGAGVDARNLGSTFAVLILARVLTLGDAPDVGETACRVLQSWRA